MFVQMAESDIFKFTIAARNQEYPLRLFMKNRIETWIYNLHLLENKNVKVNSANSTNMKKKNKLHI